MKGKLLKRVAGDWRVNAAFGVLAVGKALKEHFDGDMYERNRNIAQATGAFVLAGLNKRTFGKEDPEENVEED